MSKRVQREAFQMVGETCPHVDAALAAAAALIKDQTTALRDALISALERAIEAEDRVADLESENAALRSELTQAQEAASHA